MLQQNDIRRIPDAFKVLIKLRNIRLDRNRLTSIDNLINCAALRSLNLSYNQLTSIEVTRKYLFILFALNFDEIYVLYVLLGPLILK